MSYTVDYGYTRNTTTTKNLVIADNDNATLWDIAPVEKPEKVPAGQVTVDYTNATSPRDRVARLRRWNRQVDNVYNDAKINVVNQSPVKTGSDIGVTQRCTLKITDSVTSESVYLPFKATINLVAPVHEAVTADVCKNILTDLLSTMFPLDTVTSNQIAKQLNGSFVFLDETTP